MTKVLKRFQQLIIIINDVVKFLLLFPKIKSNYKGRMFEY